MSPSNPETRAAVVRAHSRLVALYDAIEEDANLTVEFEGVLDQWDVFIERFALTEDEISGIVNGKRVP